MYADQLFWLKYKGPEYCLDWVTKMEDELLECVTLMTPTIWDYSQNIPYGGFEAMVYTIEDFYLVSRKGKVYFTADGLLFS